MADRCFQMNLGNHRPKCAYKGRNGGGCVVKAKPEYWPYCSNKCREDTLAAEAKQAAIQASLNKRSYDDELAAGKADLQVWYKKRQADEIRDFKAKVEKDEKDFNLCLDIWEHKAKGVYLLQQAGPTADQFVESVKYDYNFVKNPLRIQQLLVELHVLCPPQLQPLIPQFQQHLVAAGVQVPMITGPSQ